MEKGRLIRIAGPVVEAVGLPGIRLFDVVRVGRLGLVGEVIRLHEDIATIQVYEDTSGIHIGEQVVNENTPFVAHLGPGLLGQVYDGLQRPLQMLAQASGEFIHRGVDVSPLPNDVRWHFTPCVSIGDLVHSGDPLGSVPESQTIEHRIMTPPNMQGRIIDIKEGQFNITQPIAIIEQRTDHTIITREFSLSQQWPVRRPRPYNTRLPPREPLITGTRIIDTFFPIAKGGSAIIPGGFGTGKTVTEHSLARWSDADVVVYIGCGERGNEMTEVLEEFPTLEDPRTGAPLMERTVLIANTSNMPVAAREASIYTGITIAEYYRDMGYDVLLLADSTSRWGEALREISGRLEEMPGEEGYPAYLGARLAEFYERSGRVITLGNRDDASQTRTGSVTVVGAVSPPGGDFSEPMTQNSMRVVGTFWALDYDLSRRRHFPSINWTNSFSLYSLSDWYDRQVNADWTNLIKKTMALLQREVELQEIVQLVGPDALAEAEKAVLMVARILREDFLQQSAYHEIDRFCPIDKAFWMLTAIMECHYRIQRGLEAGISLERFSSLPVLVDLAHMKEFPVPEADKNIKALIDRIRLSFEELGVY